MTDFADLLVRTARAVDTARMADEEQHAADEAVGTPETASGVHWDASSQLREIAQRFEVLAEQHKFAARRMDAEAQRERRTGVEYRAGRGDAA